MVHYSKRLFVTKK